MIGWGLFVHERLSSVAGPSEQKGASVGIGLCDRARGDHGATTTLVLDKYRLGELMVETIGENSSFQIDTPAGRHVHDELDRRLGHEACA
jgi:hypothetical protein